MINTGTGTLTGAALGGATMALQNDGNWDPMRIGVGTGTIFGLGVGFYDAYTIPRDDDYYIEALFSNGRYRGSVILMDTMYGAATGALVGSAVGLIRGTGGEIVDGLRIGSATGAYIGFTFGLFDAFVIGEPVPFDEFYNGYLGSSGHTPGMFSVDVNATSSLHFLDPVLISYPQASNSSGLEITSDLALQLAQWNYRF